MQELHGDKRHIAFVTQLINGNDVGVPEVASSACLRIEALQQNGIIEQTRPQGLERHNAIDQRIARLVHNAHRPLTELAYDLEFAEVPEIGQRASPGNTDSRPPKLARALRALGQEYQREMLTKQRLGVNQFSREIDSLVPRDTKGITRGSVKMTGYVSGEKCNDLPKHAVLAISDSLESAFVAAVASARKGHCLRR